METNATVSLSNSTNCADDRIPERNKMVDVMILAMLIASAVSLLVVSPGDAQRKALSALRNYDETESLTTADHHR
jgi:hypothetical protein